MKRWTLRILVLLLLGAIVNVAVAWGCSAWIGSSSGWTQLVPLAPSGFRAGQDLTLEDVEWLPIHEYAAAVCDDGYRNTASIADAEFSGLRWKVLVECCVPSFLDGGGNYNVMISPRHSAGRVWAGWPAECLTGGWSHVEPRARRMQSTGVNVTRSGFVVPGWTQFWGSYYYQPASTAKGLSPAIFIPLVPVFPGFAINTVFYAAILFALCFGFGQGRRIIRLRRGRCPNCAYDLRASESGKCPECGWGRAS